VLRPAGLGEVVEAAVVLDDTLCQRQKPCAVQLGLPRSVAGGVADGPSRLFAYFW
jgi:hypothetical protein